MEKVMRKLMPFLCSGFLSMGVYAHTPPQNIDYATSTISIDGKANEPAWSNTSWRGLNHHMLGELPSKEDFSGQFKLLWSEQYLYVLAQITDDILFDQHSDPLHLYWDDDCLEIFVDEDASGGEHQFNFNAFAYHIALDNQAVDIGPNNSDGSVQFVLLNDHVQSKWQRDKKQPHNITWEVALKLYDDTFELNSNKNTPSVLSANKNIGFMLAYCDNDGSKEREHFMGSTAITPINGDKNLGYKTADVFEKLKLKPKG
jgi:hypothetical protein